MHSQLANGGEFAKSAALWREHGDLLQLLRKPNDPSTSSVLDSEGCFQPRLVEAFSALLPESPATALPTLCAEIDLYVTGTNVCGNIFTTCDDFGHPIDVKDHRTVFKLSYRNERKNEFGKDAALPHVQVHDRIEALATLSRITSCFPVAFAPVAVNPVFEPPAQGDPRQVDFLLTRWGQLAAPCAFLDGGVLDNKPFSYTIDGIFSRTADGPVDRIMFYVEPDPERFPRQQRTAPAVAPNVLEAAIDALITIPAYESIGADLRTIAERNTRLSHYQEVRDALEYLGSPRDHLNLTLDELERSDPARYRMYCRSRLVQLRTTAVGCILRRKDGLLDAEKLDRHVPQVLAQSFSEWEGEGKATLEEFDIYFRQRRTTHLIYAVRKLLFKENGRAVHSLSTPDPGYRELLWRLNDLFELQEIICHVMVSALDEFNFEPEKLRNEMASREIAANYWKTIEHVLRALLSNPPTLEELQACYHEAHSNRDCMREYRSQLLEELIKRKAKGTPKELPRPSSSLIHRLDELEAWLMHTYAPGGPQDPIQVEFARFLWIDANLFPIEQSGGILAKDVLRTIRISPVDAQRAYGKNKTVAQKLCGDMLGHFAGFLKRSWRSNDIMWGRLDAVTQLLESVLTVERLQQVTLEQVDALNLEAIFPSASPNDLAALSKNLQNLARHQRRSDAEAVLDEIVNIAQGEILHDEIPRVLSDAIHQQREWNSYRTPQPVAKLPLFDFTTGRWTVGVRLLDKTIVSYAATQLLSRTAHESSSWQDFFRKAPYRVGEEEFPGDIPGPVLLEMGTRTALALRNCLVGTFSHDTRSRIVGSTLFKLGFDYPLRTLHAIALFQRSAPEFARVVVAIGATACIVLLAIACMFSSEMLTTPARIFGLVLLPTGVLLALAITGLSQPTRFVVRGFWYSASRLLVLGGAVASAATVALSLALDFSIMAPQQVRSLFEAGALQLLGPWSEWVITHAHDVTVWIVAAVFGSWGWMTTALLARWWTNWSRRHTADELQARTPEPKQTPQPATVAARQRAPFGWLRRGAPTS